MIKMQNIDSDTKDKLIKVGALVIMVGASGYIIYHLYTRISFNALIKCKQDHLAEKKKKLFNKLKALKTPFDNIENITNVNLEELIAGIDSGKFQPVDVLHAYQAKALLMDREYNFITDLNPNAEMDAENSLTVSKKAVLKGVPISIKDMFHVKDCYCTYGMPSYCVNPSIEDSCMVRSLRMQGAVPFVITNMCQTGKSIESSNPIFGQTLNPYNKERTSGGSSGGEGAILGSGASIIGLGSDIGGSIRIPSSYCGIFGLKPTSHRFSRRRTISLFPNQSFIVFSIGPMARRFDDLLLFFKAMACSDLYHLDPYCPPLCFNEKVFFKQRPLRIGYYTQLGESQVTSVPAVVRAVKQAKIALESAGHTLLEFKIPNIDKAMFELYITCLFTDGGYGFIDKLMQNNPVDPSLSLTVLLLKMPNFLKRIASYAVYPFNKNYSKIMHAMIGLPSVYQLWELKDKLEAYRDEVLNHWQNEKLDGIICPVLPVTAPPCQTSKYITDVIGYTAIYNVLDYPAGSVPVTKVNQTDIDELIRSYPRDTPTHRQIIELQRGSVGMPVGVQCVAMPWREEVCLRIMRDISDRLK